MKYRIRRSEPTPCPVDPEFEHHGYFGCAPKDFNVRTGRSRSHHQHRVDFHRFPQGFKFLWDGGCDGGLRKLIELVRA